MKFISHKFSLVVDFAKQIRNARPFYWLSNLVLYLRYLRCRQAFGIVTVVVSQAKRYSNLHISNPYNVSKVCYGDDTRYRLFLSRGVYPSYTGYRLNSDRSGRDPSITFNNKTMNDRAILNGHGTHYDQRVAQPPRRTSRVHCRNSIFR